MAEETKRGRGRPRNPRPGEPGYEEFLAKKTAATAGIALSETDETDEVKVEFTGVKVEYQQPKPKAKKTYWVGILPGPETRHWWIDRPNDPKNAGHEIPPHWRGLCPHFQQLDMAGMSFPAFTTIPMGKDANGSPMYVYRPGTVMSLDADEIEKLKKASVKNFVREKRDTSGSPVVKVGSGEIYNVEQSEYRFRPDTDKPYAYYIYVKEIQDEREIPDLETFIDNPPKSLMG